MSADIRIFEPLYAVGQTLTDLAFAGLSVTQGDHAQWREFRLLIDLWRTGEAAKQGFTGLFSPKFGMKTKRDGQDFMRFVQGHVHADVCFINPFPQLAYWSYNVWMQGEYAHPGIVAAAQSLLDASDVAMKIADTGRHDARFLAYSNFWVGSPAFWDAYVGGVLDPIARFLEADPHHPVAVAVLQDTLHTDPAPFLPFIVERLFSTFLSTQPSLRIASYILEEGVDATAYCVSPYERRLLSRMRPYVDAADRAGHIDASLFERMDSACELWQQHFFDYFASRPHPHTGRVVTAG